MSVSIPISTSRMPGGGIARRPLHFVILADCSGSMKGEKIQALNFAIAEMLAHLAAWERDQERAQLLVQAIAFATEPRVHIAEPTPVAQVRWQALRAVVGGRTNMAPAFRAAAEMLVGDRLPRRALRPALLLITDGQPTDLPDAFDAGLAELTATAAGGAALRMAVAIGRDARSTALTRFIGDAAMPVLFARDTHEIADRLVAASVVLSGAGAGRAVPPPAAPGPSRSWPAGASAGQDEDEDEVI